MGLNTPDIELLGIAPEIALVIGALVILIVDAVIGDGRNKWHLWMLSTITLGLSIFFAAQAWGTTELHLGDMIAVDGFATFVKITLAVFALLTVWLSRGYLHRDGIEESEFYALLLFSVAGMMLMASAADLIMVFLALETFSLALYVLVGFRRTSLTGQESAMKYFLLGAFSSAFLLLGIAFVYGAIGSTQMYGSSAEGASAQGIATTLVSLPAGDFTLLVIATGFLIVGLGFKVAAVPFHMWTPDAYQGAPAPVTGFMAAATKLAGFAALIRLLDAILFPLRADWRPLVLGIAVLTMVVGSVLAIVQEDLKRLLAYSSIAHAGFVLTGIVATNDRGVSGSLFYLATYGITVLGAFAVIALLGGRDERRHEGRRLPRPLLRQPSACRRSDTVPVVSGGSARDCGLRREARRLRSCGRGRLLLARRRRRGVERGCRIFLSEGSRRHVHAGTTDESESRQSPVAWPPG